MLAFCAQISILRAHVSILYVKDGILCTQVSILRGKLALEYFVRSKY